MSTLTRQADTATTWCPFDQLTSLGEFDLIINTTPVGMNPNEADTPLSAELLATAPDHAGVYDLIYRPLETRLLREAQAQGLATKDGLDMLICQGVAAFELWTETRVPERLIPRLREKLAAAMASPV